MVVRRYFYVDIDPIARQVATSKMREFTTRFPQQFTTTTWKANVATLFRRSVRMKLTLPKLGLGSPLGLPKLQSSITGVKTPCIGAFFI
jgi:hypothetical protein